MTQAKKGDTVKIHYTGRLEDGSVFDSSENREPLQFTIGSGQVIPGFDNGVTGMTVGEEKTVTIPPEQAYGMRRDDLVAKIDRSQIPAELELEVGKHLQSRQPDGSVINLVVTELTDDQVTVDANMPLAGKTLIFDMKLVEIV